MAWFNRFFSFSKLCSEQFFLNSRLKFHNFTVSKQHTSGFMFQKHFSRTDQKTAPVHVLPRDALSSNHRCASFCRALHLKMRENLSAIDFLHFRCRVCKFLASKTLQFSAQNSPTAGVRPCASHKIAAADSARLRLVVRCFQNCAKTF